MKTYLAATLGAVLALSQPAFADVRELSQTDLRDAVMNDQAIASHQLLQDIETDTGGAVISMRVFAVQDNITFQVLVRYDTGKLDAMFIDGVTGEIVPTGTPLGTRISAFAQASQ